MVWKIKTGVLAFLGTCFQHKGFFGVLIIVPIEKSLFTSFFFCLINNLCLISLSDQGNETKSTSKLSNFNFQRTKTLYSNISTLWTFKPDKLNSLRWIPFLINSTKNAWLINVLVTQFCSFKWLQFPLRYWALQLAEIDRLHIIWLPGKKWNCRKTAQYAVMTKLMHTSWDTNT